MLFNERKLNPKIIGKKINEATIVVMKAIIEARIMKEIYALKVILIPLFLS